MAILSSVSLWFDHDSDLLNEVRLRDALSVIRELNEPNIEKLFYSATIDDSGDPTAQREQVLETAAEGEITDLLKEALADPRSHCSVSTRFTVLEYEPRRRALSESRRRLQVDVYGSAFGWRGFERRKYGRVKLTFFSSKDFSVPRDLIADVRALRADIGLIGRFRAAAQWPVNLMRGCVTRLRVSHALSYSDLTIHPLAAHAVFHCQGSHFLDDLRQIARLQVSGGAYGYECADTDPGFEAPWRDTRRFGAFRTRDGIESAWALGEEIASLRGLPVASPEIDAMLGTALLHTPVIGERIGDGWLVAATDALSYVDDVFRSLKGSIEHCAHDRSSTGPDLVI